MISAFIFILLIASILLRVRITPIYEQEIKENEISSYKSLNNIELGIYSEILNSLVDIELLKEEIGRYPNIEELEQEMIPPYFKDETWEKKGKIQWIPLYHDDNLLYYGKSQKMEITGSFLIEINDNDITKSNIYYLTKDYDDKILRDNFDILKGKIKLIKAYTGADERRKFRED